MARPKGLAKTGGRKKGTPNQLTGDVKSAIFEAFEKLGGVAWLVKEAKKDPKTFAALLGRLVPYQVNGGEDDDGNPVPLVRPVIEYHIIDADTGKPAVLDQGQFNDRQSQSRPAKAH